MRLQLDTALPGLSGPGGSSAASATTGANARGSAASANQSTVAGDSASLSGTSNLLSQLSAERTARIANLTSAVQDGSYNVPSASISRAIVNEAFS